MVRSWLSRLAHRLEWVAVRFRAASKCRLMRHIDITVGVKSTPLLAPSCVEWSVAFSVFE